MKATVSINAHYPVVTYGNAEVNFTLEVSDSDINFPPGCDPLQKGRYLAALTRTLAIQDWVNLRDEVEQKILAKLISLLPPEVENKLIAEGRLKR